MLTTVTSVGEWTTAFLDGLQVMAKCTLIDLPGPAGVLDVSKPVPSLSGSAVTRYTPSAPDDEAAWIVSMTLKYARQATPVLLRIRAGSATTLAHQFASAMGRIDRNRLRCTMLTDDEWPRLTATVEELRSLPIVLVESAPQTQGNEDVLGAQIAAQFNATNLVFICADGKSGRAEAKLRCYDQT